MPFKTAAAAAAELGEQPSSAAIAMVEDSMAEVCDVYMHECCSNTNADVIA